MLTTRWWKWLWRPVAGQPLAYAEIRKGDMMNEFTVPRRCLVAAGIVLALICPAVAQAQQPARDMLPFKASVSGVADVFIVPVDPPLISARLNFKGTSDLLGGAVTWLDLHIGHLGVDGTPIRITDAASVFTGLTGDSLFAYWAGAI
jgi:hypothetical protein